MTDKRDSFQATTKDAKPSTNLYDPWERHFVSQNNKDAFYRSLENRPASSSSVSK